ncbi:MAG: acyl carrier protein [Syntrophobacteraceae bacterium]
MTDYFSKKDDPDHSPASKDFGLTKAALLAAGPEDRQGLAETYLAEQVARELMIPLHEIDIRQPLTVLGLDSLDAVTVINQVEADLDISMPVVRLLDGHSVSVLATLLCDQLHTRSENSAFDPKAAVRGTVENIQLERAHTNMPAVDRKQEGEDWEEGAL